MTHQTDLRAEIKRLFEFVDDGLDHAGHPPEDLSRHLLLGAAEWIDACLAGGSIGGADDRLRPAVDRLDEIAADEAVGAGGREAARRLAPVVRAIWHAANAGEQPDLTVVADLLGLASRD